MALITRCPVCGTLFKVVPDQLRISEGWVRCGHCAEIFDASGDLQQSFAEHPEVQPAGPLPEVPPLPPVPVPVELPPEPIHLPELEQIIAEPMPALEEEPKPSAQMEAPISLPAPVVEDVLDSPIVLLPEPVEDDSYSFTRETPSQAVLPRPVLRGLWTAAAAVLVVALGLQGVFQGRDRLAATWPEIRPWLQAACARLGCTVQALRQIEAIVIDSSTLSALQDEDAYRLSLVLKNQATLDLAMPAIEFVLTDSDEKAVFRRVLTPAELGAASRVLFAGREWATSVDLRVIDNPNKGRIVGYRLLAFYP
ncbi:DUF3426 domain-containing protein [Rhodoferax sp.]|uniref:DUF3426 domain-containing protein n=1 Tax=Rhodoferax sp. TaxID=50421 RepID=UPI0025F58983|nr:DUF3426 domain-containing protein [Rhodoferax sp.]